MNFTTVSFVFFLLPITLLYYFAIGASSKTKFKNLILLIASLVFYSWCGVQYLLLLLGLIVVNYGLVTIILKKRRKAWLALAVVLNAAVLAVFKYSAFLMESLNDLFGLLGIDSVTLPEPRIPLPLGISFFIFQIIALLADAYKGKIEKISLFDMTLFIMFFPQLVQGPILRYSDMSLQMKERTRSKESIESGVKRFIQGFGKKVLIADNLASVSDQIFELSTSGVANLYAWIGIFCYAFVIYYDFSGYSDMAIGLCKVFGFDIPENFNYPYISKSIQEFWRRWHISLSSWFRDYVYIPLGGNRAGAFRTYRNLAIVFLLTGIWHGAQWTFIVWGIFHGVFMLLERVGLKNLLSKIPGVFNHIYCLLVVLVGWVFFRAEDMAHAIAYLKCMFIPNEYGYQNIEILKEFDFKFVVVFLFACFLSTPKIREFLDRLEAGRFGRVFKYAYLLLFIVAVASMMGGSFSPSIYEKF